MSVELAIRLGDKTVSKTEFLAALSGTLKDLFKEVPSLTWTDEGAGDAVLGGSATSFSIECGVDAKIEVQSSTIGSEETWGEDGGWWVTLSIWIRSSESFLLLLGASGCLGQKSASEVVDEAGLLKRGRWVKPAEVFAIAEEGRGLPFAEAARVVCARLGVTFG